MMSVLDEILAVKRDEVTVLHQPETRDVIRRAALAAGPTRGLERRIRLRSREDGVLGVIAEIKRRSPSKGELVADLDAGATAGRYQDGGAAGLSVLTDQQFFGGTVADLAQARVAAASTPVLRKDFTIDPDQVYESRGIGADAILLIAAAVPDDGLFRELHELARALDLDVLVEVHDDDELDRALAIGASMVGVNARDLGTFREDLAVGERLVTRLPASVVAVAESAIRSVADAQRMAEAGFDAVLVGEALVRSHDPRALVAELTAVPSSPRTPR
jgi:indole-3-glycerol phosphate synthase